MPYTDYWFNGYWFDESPDTGGTTPTPGVNNNADYLSFKGVSYLERDLIKSNLLHGIVDFYNWATLSIGGFQNITVNPSTSGVYGGDRATLRPVNDRRYATGAIWEGFRGNWVWETGINFPVQPIHVSGVWVNNLFYGSGHSTYGHYIDYNRGRVVFNSGIPITRTVKASFSPRTVTYTEGSHPYIRKLMYDSYNISKSDFLAYASGNWNEWADNRLQLPVVSLEIGNTSFSPYALGGGQWMRMNVTFRVFAENIWDCDKLTDIITMQNDKTIWIANRAILKESGVFPCDLDYRGAVVANPIQYPELVGDNSLYRWRKVQFTNTTALRDDYINDWLYTRTVQTTILAVMGNI